MTLRTRMSYWDQTKYRLYNWKQQLTYHVSKTGRASNHALSELRDRYTGKRCFILGNGPSLRYTDLSKLKSEFTFGLNRIYLLFPEMGYPTSWLVTMNRLVMEQCAQEILASPTVKFLPWSFSKKFASDPPGEVIFFQDLAHKAFFGLDARKPLWPGATVTYVAMQLAYHMGFKQVVLVGVDHSFTTQGKPHTEVVSQGEDPNHFSPQYFGKGFRWNLPDLVNSEKAYRLARQAFLADGRQILDATIGGKLDVFPKVDYQSLFP